MPQPAMSQPPADEPAEAGAGEPPHTVWDDEELAREAAVADDEDEGGEPAPE